VTKLLLRYVNEYRDVRGKVRRYFRRRGFKKVPLPGLPGSEEFMAAYQAALAGVESKLEIGASRTTPRTIDALIVAYFRSRAFTEALAPETQRMRRNILDRFRTEHGGKRVATLESRHVAKLIKDPVHAQKNWLKTLRGLMLFAISENYRADDPTAGVKAARPAVKSRGHMTWGAAEIDAYRARHAPGTTARLAIELLLNVAARRGDAHKLGIQHVKDGRITWRPNKTARSTDKVLSIRILPELQAALNAMHARDTSLAFVLNDYGKPFASPAAFGNKFADWCKDAGLKPVLCADGRATSYRAHGLRKAACKALAHAGCTGPEIMAVSGHSSLAQVQIYIDEVDRDQMADAAITKLVQKANRK
jgi:integrase/recombinase XerD